MPSTSKSYSCCGKWFKNIRALAGHSRIHGGIIKGTRRGRRRCIDSYSKKEPSIRSSFGSSSSSSSYLRKKKKEKKKEEEKSLFDLCFGNYPDDDDDDENLLTCIENNVKWTNDSSNISNDRNEDWSDTEEEEMELIQPPTIEKKNCSVDIYDLFFLDKEKENWSDTEEEEENWFDTEEEKLEIKYSKGDIKWIIN